MSVTCTLTRPVFRALPRRLSSIGAAIMRGKSVSTSTESTSFLQLEQPFRRLDHDAAVLHFLDQREGDQRAAAQAKEILRAGLFHVLDHAAQAALHIDYLEADQVDRVELAFLQRRQVRPSGPDLLAPQLVRSLAALDPAQRHQISEADALAAGPPAAPS